MKVGPREQIIIGALLIVLFAVAVFFLAILPKFGQIGELKAEAVSLEAQKADAQTLLDVRLSAKENAAKTQVELLDIASRFPDSPELPALIIELQDAANRAEIEFIQVTPDIPSTEGDVLSIPVTLVIDGSWQQFIDFLSEIRDLRREIRISEFSANGVPPEGAEGDGAAADPDAAPATSTEETEPHTVSAQVTIIAYMMNATLAPSADATAVPGAPPAGTP